MVGGQLGHPHRPIVPPQRRGEVVGHRDRDDAVGDAVQQGERCRLRRVVKLSRRQLVEDRVGDHERAGEADGVRERDAQLVRLNGQRRRREPSHRPADEHHTVGVVDPLTGELDRGQQIGSTAVRGRGIPVRGNDTQTVAGDQLSERPNRGTRVGLLAVPEQNRALGRLAENIRQTTGGVFDRLHAWWLVPRLLGRSRGWGRRR